MDSDLAHLEKFREILPLGGAGSTFLGDKGLPSIITRICEYRYLPSSPQHCISSPLFLGELGGGHVDQKPHTCKGILPLETKKQQILFLGTSLSSRHLLLLGDLYAITV